VLLAAMALLMCGCATGGGRSVPLDQLHLLSVPIAVNFDNAPGADGFAIKVYASRQDVPKPVAISNGSVEILMFDGVVRAGELNKVQPLRTWSFDTAALRARQYRTSIGVGYQFAISWGDAKPTAGHITVLARYRAADGRSLTSLPSSIVTNIQ
jgi:hypothetical protein